MSLKHPRVVVELGMGDGRLLCQLSRDEQNLDTQFIGIEIDTTLYKEAMNRIRAENVALINDHFENTINGFGSETLDQVIMILPDPMYIDYHYYEHWVKVYSTIFLKLKKLGILEIVTEIIDELLEPVSDIRYRTWGNWLLETFIKLGFGVKEILNEAPPCYSSTCLDRFRGDPKRIRIITLRLFKPLSNRNGCTLVGN
jgi:hypothetical protein